MQGYLPERWLTMNLSPESDAARVPSAARAANLMSAKTQGVRGQIRAARCGVQLGRISGATVGRDSMDTGNQEWLNDKDKLT